jgi:hypothetical protein
MRERATKRGTIAWACVEYKAKSMGLPNESTAADSAGFSHLADLGLMEMARVLWPKSGGSPPADSRELVARSITTSDLPKVFADISNKLLQFSYLQIPGTFGLWTAKTASSNFRPFSIARCLKNSASFR